MFETRNPISRSVDKEVRQKRSTVNALAGTQRGDLSIIKIDHLEPRKGNIWLCKCKCGKEVLLPTSRLMSGKSSSCPECAKQKSIERSKKQLTTHGLWGKNRKLYMVWHSMISRCEYHGDTNYEYYGGESKHVCNEWRHDFKAFYDWAIKNGYKPELSIDRIDNTKGYSPQNCRWETQKVQVVNSRSSKLVTINGTTMCLADWARAAGVWRQTIYKWRDAGILEQKIMKRLPDGYFGRTVLIKGQKVTICEEAV